MEEAIAKCTLNAIRNLCYIHVGNASLLISHDVLTPLFRLLDSEEIEVKKQVVDIFWNLTAAPGAKDILRDRGCIARLASLLSSDNNGEMRLNILGALCAMAHMNVANQRAIRKAVKRKDLLSFLMDEDIEVRLFTAGLLSKQALNIEMKECQLKLALNNVVTSVKPTDALVMLTPSMETIEFKNKDISWLTPLVMLLSDEVINVELGRKITNAFIKLAEDVNYGDIIRELGGVTAMIKMLSNTDAEVHSNASTALASLMRNEINRQIIKERGVIIDE
jgi:hypothetical protein